MPLSIDDIRTYLEFLEQHAGSLASKPQPTAEDLRSVNLEVRKFIDRCDGSDEANGQIAGSLATLKLPVDETRPPSKYWIRNALIYGILRFLPGAFVAAAMDKKDSKQRKEQLVAFRDRVGQLRRQLDA